MSPSPTFPSYEGEKYAVVFYRNNTISWQEGTQNLIEHIHVERGLNDEAGMVKVKIYNEENQDILEEDAVEIYLATEGTLDPTKIFSGRVEERNRLREEGDAKLEIVAFGWIDFLNDLEVELSYPTVTNAQTIALGIVLDITSADTITENPNTFAITIDGVESTTKTRVVDFEGLTMNESLLKLGDRTNNDFYLDPDKDLQWFARGSRDSGKTISAVDVDDYEYEEERRICNYAKVYGSDTKTYPNPWEIDDLSDSTIGWDDDNLVKYETYHTSAIGTSATPKRSGSYSIFHQYGGLYDYPGTMDTQARLQLARTLPNTIDLSKKESYTVLSFAAAAMLYFHVAWVGTEAKPTTSSQLTKAHLFLEDSSARRVSFPFQSISHFFHLGQVSYSKISLTEFNIPVGPGEVEDGKWNLDNSTFDWSEVVKIAWRLEVEGDKNTWTTGIVSPTWGIFFMDWVHFRKGRWYGEYKLADDDSTVVKYGRKEMEFFDDSAYSNEDCETAATFYVAKFQEPISYLSHIIIDYVGMESLDPGDKVYFDLPEGTFNMRITKIVWDWDDGLEGKLFLDSDPY